MKFYQYLTIISAFFCCSFPLANENKTCISLADDVNVCNEVKVMNDSIIFVEFTLVTNHTDSLIGDYEYNLNTEELMKNKFVANCSTELECVSSFYREAWGKLTHQQIELINNSIHRDFDYKERFFRMVCKNDSYCIDNADDFLIVTYYRHPMILVDPFLIKRN